MQIILIYISTFIIIFFKMGKFSFIVVRKLILNHIFLSQLTFFGYAEKQKYAKCLLSLQ